MRNSLFIARRLYALAQIADGLGMLIGLRFRLGIRAARRIARINGTRALRKDTR